MRPSLSEVDEFYDLASKTYFTWHWGAHQEVGAGTQKGSPLGESNVNSKPSGIERLS